MSATDRHLEWRNFRRLIEDGIPAAQPVSGSPAVVVFVSEGGARIGLRAPIPADAKVPASPLADIDVRTTKTPGEPEGALLLEVSTSATRLFAEFYGLLEDLADRIQLRGVPPVAALAETISNWKALLRPAERLSEEQQIGLLGELWLLERLIRADGPSAVHAWTGPLAEPHDFRRGVHEIEVKSTRSRGRVHMISSLEQLQPSPDRELYLLSLQFEPAGTGGWSLPEQVDSIRSLLNQSLELLETFEQGLLVGWRYADIHAGGYQDRFTFRVRPMLVAVTSGFPKITSQALDAMIGVEAKRITDIQYRLDVAGLGVMEGSAEFAAIVPPLPEGPKLA